MNKPRLMKDRLGNDAVITISHALSTVIEDFAFEQFIVDANNGLESLELKQRVDHVIAILAKYLPTGFDETAVILLSLKRCWNTASNEEGWQSFAVWPLIDYVAVYGLEKPELALKVLKALTPLFTAEFAIRPFIEQHFELTYQHLESWCNDPDEHVRRLVSEGTRPRLPWAKQLKQFRDNPQPIVNLLERLKDDSSRYVQRSVANNLNDISKDHPELVIELCQGWSNDAAENRKWIIKHGCRNLIKLGEPVVFSLLGFTDTPKISVEDFRLEKKQIILGESQEFSFVIKSLSNVEQVLMLDYKIHFVKSNQTRTKKVFKLKTIKLKANKAIHIEKKHLFQLVTIRKYYPGYHSIELIINGNSYGVIDFNLLIK
jgi:3-methyladenine DNA glycosylase AlkC